MLSLKDVISALRRELAAAFEENQPAGLRLEPERVVISLEIAVEKGEKTGELSYAVLETDPSSSLGLNGGAKQAHTVTIEFKPVQVRPAAATPQESEKKEKPPGPIHTKAESADKDWELIRALALVFGEPGFDSSARATVFREALGGMSDGQIRAVMDSLQGAPVSEWDETIRNTRHLILGITRSGPLQSQEQGGEVLMEIFQGRNASEILRLIEEHWKTQDHWLG
jgi:hypothetical protein